MVTIRGSVDGTEPSDETLADALGAMREFRARNVTVIVGCTAQVETNPYNWSECRQVWGQRPYGSARMLHA